MTFIPALHCLQRPAASSYAVDVDVNVRITQVTPSCPGGFVPHRPEFHHCAATPARSPQRKSGALRRSKYPGMALDKDPAAFDPRQDTALPQRILDPHSPDLPDKPPNNVSSRRKKSLRRRLSFFAPPRAVLLLMTSIQRYLALRFRILFTARKQASSHSSQFITLLLGVLLSLLFTALTTFLAYKSSPAYYPTGKQPSTLLSQTRHYVSPYTADKLKSSLGDARNEQFVENALVRSFNFPPSLSRKIPILHRYALLTRIQNAQNKKRAVPLKLFVLHVVGSSAVGRLEAIASAITYAKNTDRFLLILWDIGRGGEVFGEDAISMLHAGEKNNIMLTSVESLQLSPNLTNWSEFQINYYTKSRSGGYPLDSVAALATRHIFYRTEKEVEGRYASISPGVMNMPNFLTPGSAIQREWYNFVKDWTFPNLDITEVADILNRVYGVPLVFIEGMSDDSKRKLLRGLSRSTSKRAFFIHAQYGLGNRLRALGSAMAVAKVTGRVLVLIWEPDVHLNCRFSDLFANDLITIEKLNMNWPPGESNRKDYAMRTVDFYNFMRFQGKHIHNPLKQLVNPRTGRHVYAKTAYVVRSSFAPRIISTTSSYWQVMREQLIPTAEIMHLVHDPSFINIRGMVGVHIRSRTIDKDIKGVSEEFYGDGSRTTDHWRRLTGLKTFEDKIMRLNLRYKFYVAADTREAITALERKFGSHRIFSLPRDQDCVTRDVECAKLALVDILLLSKTPTLLGSNWSSFSECAVRLSGRMKVLLAGVHFGRSKSKSK